MPTSKQPPARSNGSEAVSQALKSETSQRAVAWSHLDEGVAWLQEFESTHGRPLRVLHVGNIANNAYLNATFLRRAGIECHVLSYDYYDIFATPEWEGSPARPDWFVQGPFGICSRYLIAKVNGRRVVYRLRWHQLQFARTLYSRAAHSHRHMAVSRVVVRGYAAARRGWRLGRDIARLVRRRIHRAVPGLSPLPSPAEASALKANEFIARYDEVFPERPDRLTSRDVEPWFVQLDDWTRLFSMYDVVQCYATDPIRALLSGVRPYVAYEHGTLRDFTLGDEPLHRLNALAYRLADHVFITNGDCLAYAETLGIERFTPMVHPVDVEQHQRNYDREVREIRDGIGADVLLLCPLRHDWAIKGTDMHLRALPELVARFGDVVLVLCDWGAEVAESKVLIAELGCESNVRWLPPLNREALIAHIKAADVVLDQMALPHFGATAPQALSASTPVVMSYDPASTEWIVPEPAPILSAVDPAGVVDAVRTALDPMWRATFEERAAGWVRWYHHPDRIVQEHCRIYRTILGGK